MLNILLSNDDGVTATGIQTLAAALRQHYHVQVIAPDRNRSGASNALTLDRPLKIQTLSNGDLAVQEGTPTDCVYIGVNKVVRPRPDIVVSGINCGPNLGDDVIYSGTVAAATEGRHLGLPSIAVSLDGDVHYETAAKVTCDVLNMLQKNPLRAGNILNINVPDIPYEALKGIKVTRCGSRHAASEVYNQEDPRGNMLYWLGPVGEIRDAGPGTDFEAVQNGYVSITPLQVDLTSYKTQAVLEEWLDKSGVKAK
ncbi:5'/3'-nucleotidase SurE [Providencia alcalifaciens]|uniref:5'/3'-nucleotidase SurE n=1 Tax=Providencia alcalifaciens TaxID=126385 RepID=UPI001CC3E843|nr:5'/3'-nucleotidase SurE [Providencia alcalifaciens]CAG9427307.1 5'/3'-nucleotidase SurE [Providencia alcalifaciens]